jgi:hypothetical protein
VPPNNGMEPTAEIVTSFACAKAAPIPSAAHPRRLAARRGGAMSWEAIGAISEVIAAVAVVVTLAYLALQIRQSTRTTKAAAVSASHLSLRENRHAILASAELSTLFATGAKDPTALSDLESQRFIWMMLNGTDALLDIYTQTLETDFSPETWHTQGVWAVRRILGNPGGRWFWEQFSGTYPARFRQEIDRVLSMDRQAQE